MEFKHICFKQREYNKLLSSYAAEDQLYNCNISYDSEDNLCVDYVKDNNYLLREAHNEYDCVNALVYNFVETLGNYDLNAERTSVYAIETSLARLQSLVDDGVDPVVCKCLNSMLLDSCMWLHKAFRAAAIANHVVSLDKDFYYFKANQYYEMGNKIHL